MVDKKLPHMDSLTDITKAWDAIASKKFVKSRYRLARYIFHFCLYPNKSSAMLLMNVVWQTIPKETSKYKLVLNILVVIFVWKRDVRVLPSNSAVLLLLFSENVSLSALEENAHVKETVSPKRQMWKWGPVGCCPPRSGGGGRGRGGDETRILGFLTVYN